MTSFNNRHAIAEAINSMLRNLAPLAVPQLHEVFEQSELANFNDAEKLAFWMSMRRANGRHIARQQAAFQRKQLELPMLPHENVAARQLYLSALADAIAQNEITQNRAQMEIMHYEQMLFGQTSSLGGWDQ